MTHAHSSQIFGQQQYCLNCSQWNVNSVQYELYVNCLRVARSDHSFLNDIYHMIVEILHSFHVFKSKNLKEKNFALYMCARASIIRQKMDLYRTVNISAWERPYAIGWTKVKCIILYATMQKKTQKHVMRHLVTAWHTQYMVVYLSIQLFTHLDSIWLFYHHMHIAHTQAHPVCAIITLFFAVTHQTKSSTLTNSPNRPNIKQPLWIIRMRWERCTHTHTHITA